MCAFICYLGKSLAIFMMAKADVSIRFQVIVHHFNNGAVCGTIFYVGSQI